MVLKKEPTYSENEYIHDVKHIATTTTGYTFLRGNYEFSDPELMLKSLLLDDVKVNITIDDIGPKSNSTTI